jgi:hypothetical protein
MSAYKYHFSRYNAHQVLRVNLPTVFATLFLARHVLLVFFISMASRAGRLGGASGHGAFSGLIEPIYMIADIPAVLVFLAMLARHPKSGAAVRIVWRCGPYLLLASALTYGYLLFDTIGWTPARYHWPVWASLLGTAAAAAYVFLSPYARDLFREFPERAEEEEKRS